MNFGSPNAGTTPNSNSILAQPPLQPSNSPSAQESSLDQLHQAAGAGELVHFKLLPTRPD